MVWLTVVLAAALFGIGVLAERRLLSRAGRIGALSIGFIVAIPGLLFVLYYTHLFDGAAWFYEFRAMRGSELAACGLGFVAGFIHSALEPSSLGERVAAPAIALTLLLVPYSKPWLAPLNLARLSDRCDGEVCLQSTLSTCGPATAATILNSLGSKTSEKELATECHTYQGGTESWYLARAIRRRGFEARFQIEPENPSSLPSPAIAGVILRGGAGHFIAVLSQTPERVVIADPMKGKLVIDRAELRRAYHFTGFFLVVGRVALSSRLVEAFVMQTQEVTRREREGGVGPAIVVTELDFENSGVENFHDGAHLPADETGIRHIAHQSNDRK
jgi:predicted double-glycine peptidase